MTMKKLSKRLYPFIAIPLLTIVCFFLGLNIAFLISTYLDFIRTFHSPMLWIILYLCVSVGVQINYVDKVSKNIKEELRGKNDKEIDIKLYCYDIRLHNIENMKPNTKCKDCGFTVNELIEIKIKK